MFKEERMSEIIKFWRVVISKTLGITGFLEFFQRPVF
jgi:hypothetical protein